MKDSIRNLDDARLRPHLRMQKPEPRVQRYVAPDNGTTHVQTLVMQHSPEDLRGIPVVGRGVGGVSPGTNPESAAIRNLSRERAA